MSIRDQVKNQETNFRNALVSSGMALGPATIFAKELTEIVALKYLMRKKIDSMSLVATKKE